MVAQVGGQRADVKLSAADVVAGFLVAGLGQRSHRHDGGVLDHADCAGTLLDNVFEHAVAVAQRIGCSLEAQLGAYAGQYQRRADRLGDVIHRTDIEAQLLVHFFGADGQEDHRNVRSGRLRLEPAADFVSIESGHHHVEQDQVGRRRGEGQFQRPQSVSGDAGAVMGLLQAPHDGFDGVRHVVDHQHGWAFGGAWHGVQG
ncbi:hypothetical protein SDC9_163428 [bioreactor metagenome]|uniref:Uncharacterized protein n=1 Tax=bioreactor metagenome TaxID=1076179 RepID=A0A645FQ36_9ZZZZ